MGECSHAAASLWLEHAPSIGLAIGPRQQHGHKWYQLKRLRAFHIQRLWKPLRSRNHNCKCGYQSHFCDCDDLPHHNVNCTIEMLWTHICHFTFAIAIAVCERALRLCSHCLTNSDCNSDLPILIVIQTYPFSHFDFSTVSLSNWAGTVSFCIARRIESESDSIS